MINKIKSKLFLFQINVWTKNHDAKLKNRMERYCIQFNYIYSLPKSIRNINENHSVNDLRVRFKINLITPIV